MKGTNQVTGFVTVLVMTTLAWTCAGVQSSAAARAWNRASSAASVWALTRKPTERMAKTSSSRRLPTMAN